MAHTISQDGIRPNREKMEALNNLRNNLKRELTTQSCLSHYNGNNENIVTTDASKTGIGIALWQKQANGDLKPIVFASRLLNDAEKIIQSAKWNYWP